MVDGPEAIKLPEVAVCTRASIMPPTHPAARTTPSDPLVTQRIPATSGTAGAARPPSTNSRLPCLLSRGPVACYTAPAATAVGPSSMPFRLKTIGNQSSRSLSPETIPCPGNGGEVRPGRST